MQRCIIIPNILHHIPSCKTSCSRNSLRNASARQARDGENVHAIGTAHCVTTRGQHGAKRRLAHYRCVDFLLEREQALRTFLNKRGSQLHFEQRISTITELHNGIRLATRFIVIVEHFSAKRLRIHPQIAYAQRFKQKPKRGGIHKQGTRPNAKGRRRNRGARKMTRRRFGYSGLRMQRRRPSR